MFWPQFLAVCIELVVFSMCAAYVIANLVALCIYNENSFIARARDI